MRQYRILAVILFVLVLSVTVSIRLLWPGDTVSIEVAAKPVEERPARSGARGSSQDMGGVTSESLDRAAMRSELAQVRTALDQLRAQVDERDANIESPEPSRPSLSPEEQEQQIQAAVAAHEARFREALSREPGDHEWTAEITDSVRASLEHLPGVSLESAQCGRSVCIAEVRHDNTRSAGDIWSQIGSSPVFSGQVLVQSRDEGGGLRTSIYVMRPGAEPIRWVE
jgi:hypothetical protein